LKQLLKKTKSAVYNTMKLIYSLMITYTELVILLLILFYE